MRPLAMIAALSVITRAVEAFIPAQCVSEAFITEHFPPIFNIVDSAQHPANSNTGCQNYCSELGAVYSVFRIGLEPGALSSCYCSGYAALPGNQVPGDGSQGACFPDDFEVYLLNPYPYVWGGCQESMPQIDAPKLNLIAADLDVCLFVCEAYNHPYVAMVETENQRWECQCGTTMTDNPPATCGPNVPRVFRHISVAPTGFARKRELAARTRAERALGHCPRGFHACKIPGSESYECLDTSTELEACGGCAHGYFDQKKKGSIGTDCTAIHGVVLGGVSCVRGSCEVARCRNGYRLERNRCVNALGSNGQARP